MRRRCQVCGTALPSGYRLLACASAECRTENTARVDRMTRQCRARERDEADIRNLGIALADALEKVGTP